MGVDDTLTTKDKGFLRREYTHGAGSVDPALNKTHLNAKSLESLVLNEEMKGDAQAIGQQSRRNTENKSQIEEKKKERDRTRLLLQTLAQSIEPARQTLDDLGNLIDLKLEQALTGQALKQKELDEINETLQAISKGIERLEKGGSLEFETGRLKDQTLEAAIKQWEAKTGKTVDRENPAFLLLALKQSRPEYDRHKKWLEEYLDIYKEEVELCKNSESKIQKLKTEGKDIENKSPEEQKAWIEEVNNYKKDRMVEFDKIDAKKETLDNELKTGMKAASTQENVSSINTVITSVALKLDF